MTIWHNHRLKDDYTPVFPFADRIRLGDGVFDTMLAVEGSLIHAYEHFDRLLNNAKVMGMTSDKPISDLIDAARSVLKQGNLEEGRAVINTILSRGSGERGLAPPEPADLQIIMRAVPAPHEFDAVEAIFSESVRRNEGSPLSRIKSTNYGDNILAMIEAQDKGANEAILLNNKGFVTCATSSNIFVVHGGKLYTPPVADGVLPGIVRRKVIEEFNAIEKSLMPEDLKEAEGIYLTSSIRGVAMVEKLDGHKLPIPSLLIDKDFHLV
jgi:branched-chain amino acid aminotransferase